MYYVIVSLGQEFESGSVGCFWLKVLMSLQSRCYLGLQSPKSSTGVEHPLPRWPRHMAVGRKPQLLTMGLSIEPFENPYNMAAGLPQSR